MTIQIRMMREEDAPKVVDLYRTVYGDQYPVKSVYDADAIITAQAAGDFYRVLAVDGEKVVGQTAVYRSACPNPHLYEEGQGIVLPIYRNQGILEQTMQHAHEVIYPQNGLDQLWGEAVCNHVFMQKASAKLGYVLTGAEIDLMPAAAYDKERSSTGRVASLLAFKIANSGAQTIHLSAVYRQAITWLYDGLGLERRFSTDAAPLFHGGSTRVTKHVYADAGVARMTFLDLGRDFDACLLQTEQAVRSQGCTVLQAYTNLSDPDAGAAMDILRGHGYFLGGILPCWYGQDGILMQKILHEPNIAGIQLHGERARKIVAMVLEDRAAIAATPRCRTPSANFCW